MSIKKPVPVDDNGRTLAGWDPLAHAPAVPAITNSQLDGEVRYGSKAVQLSSSNAQVPAGAATTQIKTSPGTIATIVCTAAGTAATSFFDNTAGSGPLLYVTKTTPAVGDIYQINGAALVGITAVGITGSGAFTVYYS
jgi:hypothetical protein